MNIEDYFVELIDDDGKLLGYSIRHGKDKKLVDFINLIVKEVKQLREENCELFEKLDNLERDIDMSPLCYNCELEESCIKKKLEQAELKLSRIEERLKSESYLSPQTTRILVNDIDCILKGDTKNG